MLDYISEITGETSRPRPWTWCCLTFDEPVSGKSAVPCASRQDPDSLVWESLVTRESGDGDLSPRRSTCKRGESRSALNHVMIPMTDSRCLWTLHTSPSVWNASSARKLLSSHVFSQSRPSCRYMSGQNWLRVRRARRVSVGVDRVWTGPSNSPVGRSQDGPCICVEMAINCGLAR